MPDGRKISNIAEMKQALLAKEEQVARNLIERMLTEMFGMEWYKVHEEAEQLEHAVSEDFERRLVERLGPGGVCPHGNVIGLDTPEERRKRGWLPLGRAAFAGSSGPSMRSVNGTAFSYSGIRTFWQYDENGWA